MNYYLLAMLMTLFLCRYFTTPVPLPDGGEAWRFPNWKKAFLAMLPLTFVAVFRWDVGVDSLYGGSYWEAYQNAALGINNRGFEWGFFTLLRLFSTLKAPFFWFLFAHGMIFMLSCSYAMAKGSIWSIWSVLCFFLLYFYFDCFSSLRQSLAEGICLIAWAKMGSDPHKQKNFRVLLLFAVAGLFHTTAWINIPVYFLCCIRLSRNGVMKFLVLAVLLTPLIQVILRFAMELFGADVYEYKGLARINTIVAGVIVLACWFFYDGISSLSKSAHMYVNQAICIFIVMLNSGALYLPFRVFDMLKIGYVFIVPYMLRGIKNGRLRMFGQMCTLIMFAAWFYNSITQENNFAATYQTVFQDWNYITHLP